MHHSCCGRHLAMIPMDGILRSEALTKKLVASARRSSIVQRRLSATRTPNDMGFVCSCIWMVRDFLGASDKLSHSHSLQHRPCLTSRRFKSSPWLLLRFRFFPINTDEAPKQDLLSRSENWPQQHRTLTQVRADVVCRDANRRGDRDQNTTHRT